MSPNPASPAAPAHGAGRDLSAWRAADLQRDQRWVVALDDAVRTDLMRAVRAGLSPGKSLLDYTLQDFDFAPQTLALIAGAVAEAEHGRGIALVEGLPRESISPAEFELLTWAIGLHVGVARPQDKLSRYINQVKDVGAVYRSPTGRGYSSRAELDFHIDGADIVLLSCYNQAPSGGDSLCSSSVAAFRQLVAERPDLAALLEQPVAHSRQGEQAEGAPEFIQMPIYGRVGGEVFCQWNRNRIENGDKLPGAPRLGLQQREAMELLDEIVRRPEFMYSMRLKPGDMQILSNHTALHSRTEFHDHAAEDQKRLLYRLWLSTPGAPQLPSGWAPFWGSTESGLLRGGIHGHHHDAHCQSFDRRQAQAMGLRLAS